MADRSRDSIPQGKPRRASTAGPRTSVTLSSWRAERPAQIRNPAHRDKEFPRLRHRLSRPTLGDKAYAGGTGEGELLFRPIRRNEKAWKENNATSRSFNRHLSSIRVRVEHAFARIKAFRVLVGQFHLGLGSYDTVFRAVAFVCNMRRHHA